MGYGAYAHRDGYNVLYGDWSAKWYGDPQQRIMWWTPVWGNEEQWHWDMYSPTVELSFNGITRYEYIDAVAPQWGRHINSDDGGGQDIWHIFDVANGVDVGVDPNEVLVTPSSGFW